MFRIQPVVFHGGSNSSRNDASMNRQVTAYLSNRITVSQSNEDSLFSIMVFSFPCTIVFPWYLKLPLRLTKSEWEYCKRCRSLSLVFWTWSAVKGLVVLSDRQVGHFGYRQMGRFRRPAKWVVLSDRQVGRLGDRQMGRFQWLLTRTS